jgi:hypothetical protein
MPDQNPIYDFLKSNKLTDLDEKSFVGKYSAPDKAKEIYSFFVENKLTDLDSAGFYDKYLKKKEQQEVLSSISSHTKSQLASPDFEKGKAFAEKGFLMQPEGTKAPKEQEVKIEPVEKQGLILNTISSLDKSFAKNFISSPIKGLGTALEGATKKVIGGTGEGFISNNLIKFGDYLNKTIDELTPQDEEFKGTLVDQVAQAFGQIGSLVLTGGLTGAAGKGAALIGQIPKSSAAATAVKTLGSQLASPTAVSAGLSMGQAEFDRAIEAGANDDQAFEAFYKTAAVGSVLETIPVMQFFKRFNNSTGGSVANYIKTKGVAGLTGGIEEMTTEVMQQLYANKTAKDIYNINQDLLDGVGSSGGIGFGVGFVLNAMGANAKILRKQGKQQEADVLDNQVKQYEDNIENPKVTSGKDIVAKDIVTQGPEIGTKKAIQSLDRDLANNVITLEQYEEGIVFTEKAAQVVDKIPETVTGESRVKSMELLVERNDINQANQNLLQQKQTTDEAYHAGIDEEIKANEERIKKIDSEVYNIAKKPSKEFGGKKYVVDGEEVSKEAFEALTGKPIGTKEIIKTESPEEANYNVIAADYLFTGGKGVILSTDYFLQALTASFPYSSEKINEIRNRYANKFGNIKDDIGTDSYNSAINEIKDEINKTYNNKKASELFDKIVNNSTGFTLSREGNKVSSELEKLNEEFKPTETKAEVKPIEVKELEEEYNSKSVDELIVLKKKLYPSPDIESPMTPEEKLLDRVIAKKFSEKQQEIILKRKAAEKAPTKELAEGESIEFQTPEGNKAQPELKPIEKAGLSAKEIRQKESEIAKDYYKTFPIGKIKDGSIFTDTKDTYSTFKFEIERKGKQVVSETVSQIKKWAESKGLEYTGTSKENIRKTIDFKLPFKESPYQQALKEKQEADKRQNRQIGSEKAAITKEIYRKVNKMDPPADAEQIALRYLADGGKVSKEAIDEAYGSVKRAQLNTGRRELLSEEVKSKDFVQGNETLDETAHRLWEQNDQRVSETDIKDRLMAEIGNNNTRLEAAEAYLDNYNEEYKQEKEEMRMAEQYKEEYLEEQEKLEQELRSQLDEQIEGELSEEYINNLIEQYEAEIKAEDQQLGTESEGEISQEASKGKVSEKTKEDLAKDYKEVVGKTGKKAKENAKKDFVERNFDNIVEKLKIQIKCPT